MGGSVSESTDVLLYQIICTCHQSYNHSDCEVVIFDNSGKAMITQASVNGLINIHHASGVYYVQIPCKEIGFKSLSKYNERNKI